MFTLIIWNIKEVTGYYPISTFYIDFSVADMLGVDAVRYTYNRAFEEWKHDYKMLTELVMVMNWKIMEHCETNRELELLYNTLWRTIDQYASDNLKGEELMYFFDTTNTTQYIHHKKSAIPAFYIQEIRI